MKLLTNASIKTKLVSLLTICSFIPLLFIAWESYSVAQQSLKDNIHQQLRADAETINTNIENYLSNLMTHQIAWGSLPILQDVAISDEEGEITDTLVQLQKQYPTFAQIMVIDYEGMVVAASSEDSIGNDYNDSMWFTQSMLGKNYQSPIQYQTNSDSLGFVFSLPIRADYDNIDIIGVLAGVIDWQQVQTHLEHFSISGNAQSKNAQLFLFSGQNHHVYYSTEKLSNDNLSSLKEVPNKSNMNPVISYQNSNFLVSERFSNLLDDLGKPYWKTIVMLDAYTAFHQIYQLRKHLIFFLIVIVVITAVLGLYIAKTISTPIVNLVELMSSIINTGKFDTNVGINRTDEVGKLSISFNQLISKVKEDKKILFNQNNNLTVAVNQKSEALSQIEHINSELSNEINERIKADIAVEELHKKMLEISRDAGKSEVATSILHNVGNILNTVNTSNSLIRDVLGESVSTKLKNVVTEIDKHGEDLSTLLESSKAEPLLRYIHQVSQRIEDERLTLINESATLSDSIGHINNIVQQQQSNVKEKSNCFKEDSIEKIIDESINISGVLQEDSSPHITKNYHQIPLFPIDKHKVLQIIVNLLQNATQSLNSTNNEEKNINISINSRDNIVDIIIEDNGAGIENESLLKVFNYGFTTRATGHGFGLHSCANLAAEMHGELQGHSDGKGHGARFTLSIPMQQST